MELKADRGKTRRLGAATRGCHRSRKRDGDAAPLALGSFSIILRKRGRDESGDDTSAIAIGMRRGVAHEVDAAARGATSFLTKALSRVATELFEARVQALLTCSPC